MRTNAFWIFCSLVIFGLSIAAFRAGVQRKNPIFTAWLCFSVSVQLIAVWGLAAGRPRWFMAAGDWTAIVGMVLAGLALVASLRDASSPLNLTIAKGLGAMLLLDLLALLARRLAPEATTKVALVRNLAFLVPALYMLASFINLTLHPGAAPLPGWSRVPPWKLAWNFVRVQRKA